MNAVNDLSESNLDELSDIYGLALQGGTLAADFFNGDEAIYYYGLARMVFSIIQERETILAVSLIGAAVCERRARIKASLN